LGIFEDVLAGGLAGTEGALLKLGSGLVLPVLLLGDQSDTAVGGWQDADGLFNYP
jgi:hypothetical protein